MTAAVQPRFSVSGDEFQVLAQRVGIQHFPAVLSIAPRYSSRASLDEAIDRATERLVRKGLIVDGVAVPELVELLRVLERPDRELAGRLVTPDGIARLSVVRRGNQLATARRIGKDIELRAVANGAGLGSATSALIADLPAAAAAQMTPVGAPLTEMQERLSDTHDPAQLADRIRGLGVDSNAAMLLGAALASRQAFAEIVCYALSAEDDRIVRTPAAVGVFYTKRGRIVGAPSASPSGEIWSTLKPGSDHVLKQAIEQLVQLLADGWGGTD